MEQFSIDKLKLLFSDDTKKAIHGVDSFFINNLVNMHVTTNYENGKLILTSIFNDNLSNSFNFNQDLQNLDGGDLKSNRKLDDRRNICKNDVIGRILTPSDIHLSSGCCYRYCVIPFDIDIHNKHFSKSLVFEGCVFTENVTITNCTVEEDLRFSGSTFKKKVDLSHNNINRTFRADCCTFEDEVNLSNFKCDSDFSIRASRFYEKCYVYDSHFHSKTSFSGITVKEDKIYHSKSTVFKDDANFASSYFYGFAIFDQAVFESKIRFNSAVFLEKTFMQSCVMHQADFTKTRFGLYTSFDDSTFELTVAFYSTIFSGEFRIANAIFLSKPFFYNVFVGTYLKLENPRVPCEIVLNKLVVEGESEIACDSLVHPLIITHCLFRRHFEIIGTYVKINFSESIFEGSVSFVINNESIFPIHIQSTLFNHTLSFKYPCKKIDGDIGDREGAEVVWFIDHLRQSERCDAGYSEIHYSNNPEFDQIEQFSSSNKSTTIEDTIAVISIIKQIFVRQGKYSVVDVLSRKYNDCRVEQYVHGKKHNLKIQGGMLWISKKLYDYGLAVHRILLSMIMLILFFGISLFLAQWDCWGWNLLGKSFLDSAICFLTMSIGIDLQSAHPAVILICVVEGLFGVFTMSFLVTAVARKVYR